MSELTIGVQQGHNGAASTGQRDARTGEPIQHGQPILISWPGQPHACYEVVTTERLVALLRTTWPLAPETALPVLAIAD